MHKNEKHSCKACEPKYTKKKNVCAKAHQDYCFSMLNMKIRANRFHKLPKIKVKRMKASEEGLAHS